jgi:putative membrane protein
MLALRAYGPGAAIGAIQGLLVAGVVQIAASYDWGTWSLFAAVCVVAGLAFAAVNEALIAVFGGAGRWIAALVGVLVIATGIVSTVPPVLMSIASVMPTAPAYTAMLGVLGTSGGVGGALVGLVVWGGLAFVATIIAVTRRRTVSAREVLMAQVA